MKSLLLKLPPYIKDENPLIVSSSNQVNQVTKKPWSSLTILPNTSSNVSSALTISIASSLQYIFIQKQSFENTASLTLSDLPELTILIIETCCFKNTKSVTLQSTEFSLVSN